MFACVIGEGRYSSVYLCHRWREVFQCLPMSEVKGGIPMFAYVIGEGRCSSVCLCIGGRRAGGDKMRKLCVGMCCFFFLFFFFFFQCRVHGWSEVFIFFYIGIFLVCWAAVPQDSTVNTYFHKKHNYSHKMCTLANVLCACTFSFSGGSW